MKADICSRCGFRGPVFEVQWKLYCEKCAALCINDRPDYKKADRRSAGSEPRGFGRRFRDPVRQR